MKTALGLLVFMLSFAAAADVVVPVDSVDSHVNIRKSPQAGAEIVGRLQHSNPRHHVATVTGWHEVELDDGTTGFVSSDWSQVIADEADAGVAAASGGHAAVTPADGTAADANADAAAADAIADAEGQAEESAGETTAEDDVGTVADAAADPATEVVADAGPAAAEADGVDSHGVSTDGVTPAAVPGPPGPPGPAGPPGPPGEGTVKGTENYVVKFRKPTVGGNSQIWDDGNFVGVGTTEPKQRLEVNGSIGIHDQNSAVAGLMISQSDGETGYILHNRASTLTIGAGSIDRITIDREGNIGFGTSSPTHPVELASGAYVSDGGVWTNSSSRERKENIESLTLEDALAALAALEPVQFNYRDDASESYVGFIAEDVPELVATNDRESLSPMDVVAVLTRVVQQQQLQIAELEARLDGPEPD